MLYVRYASKVNSSELAVRLREEHGVLVVPGDHYGMDGHVRIGFGGEPEHLAEGIRKLSQVLAEVAR